MHLPLLGRCISCLYIKTIRFHKSECGVDILLNVLRGDDVKVNYLNTDIYNTDFFEILLFKNAKGTLVLNQQRITINENSIVFISPFQKRQWNLEPTNLDFTILAIQEDFLNDFFSDKYFTYRLLYFYQLNFPLNINVNKKDLEKVCSLLTEIKGELLNPKPDSVHIIRSLLYYLLQKFNREYANKFNLSLEKAEK